MLLRCFFGFMKKKKKLKKQLGKIWYFIWEDNSFWSWIVNIILAFVLIKFIVYPGLGFVLSTSHPVVAVVSSSMEHGTAKACADEGCTGFQYTICGNIYSEKGFLGLNEYWQECGNWYEENTNIDENKFSGFPFKNGFNKGDIMVLIGGDAENIDVGDIIVFKSDRKDPIIHRVVRKMHSGNVVSFQTKGDNNKDSIKTSRLDETNLGEDVIIGKAVFRVPLLGYIKIWFVELLKFMEIA